MSLTALSSAPPPLLSADEFVDSLFDGQVAVEDYPPNPSLRDKQRPPDGDWRIWLLLAGRGFGKTKAITHWAIDQARLMPGSRGALVAPTSADARDVLVEGESGVLNVAPPNFRPLYEPSKRRLTFPNGSTATLFSADEPNRLRGPQYHWAICDEIAAWDSPEALDQLLLGLRLGMNPRVAIATTPRPKPVIKDLLKDPTCVVVRGSTYENRDNLAPAFLDVIVRRYEGTRLGRQELNAEVLDDTPGALWRQGEIDALRVDDVPLLLRIVVGVDPMGESGSEGAEAGIVVCGVGDDGHLYVLEDVSLSGTPDTWARTAVNAYHRWQADRIVAEKNYGGEMVESTLRVVDLNVPLTLVTASRGKLVRAEPVAALYEQRRAHHVGVYPQMEDEMTSYDGSGRSPNRMDALVWAATELMLGDMLMEAVGGMNYNDDGHSASRY